ncbi:hypothetical protein JCM1840_006413 [Sporobolomyces johnsonii]
MPRGSKVAEGEEPLSRQSLKAAVWYTVTKIAQEEELSLPFAASEHFVATLAEVVFQQALSLGMDLEAYAKHAGRMMINVDDVKLAARRNEPLYDLLCTAATTHGLALADLKADRKPKLKAPRVATTKAKAATTTGSKAAANAEKMNEGDEPAPAKKVKAKSKSVPVSVPAAAGFVSAKEELAAKKEKEKEKAGKGRKRKAVSDDEEEDEGEQPRGGDARVSDAEEEEEEEGDRDEEMLASDESEDVGAKRKGKGARGKRGG